MDPTWRMGISHSQNNCWQEYGNLSKTHWFPSHLALFELSVILKCLHRTVTVQRIMWSVRIWNILIGNVILYSFSEGHSLYTDPMNKIKLNADLDLFCFLNSMFFLYFTLPLKCYGYFPPLLSPLSVEVIFYPQESHYLGSPSLLSSSLQLSWLSAILLCHSNLFLWHQYFVLTSGLHICVCVYLCECMQVSFVEPAFMVKDIG